MPIHDITKPDLGVSHFKSNQYEIDRLNAALDELKLAVKAYDPNVTGLMVFRDRQGEGEIIGAMAMFS